MQLKNEYLTKRRFAKSQAKYSEVLNRKFLKPDARLATSTLLEFVNSLKDSTAVSMQYSFM